MYTHFADRVAVTPDHVETLMRPLLETMCLWYTLWPDRKYENYQRKYYYKCKIFTISLQIKHTIVSCGAYFTSSRNDY